MPTPRSRRTSTSTPWPHLSLFAVYSATPLVEPSSSKLSDEELEAAKILYFHSTEYLGDTMTPERKRRLMGTVMGVADFAKMMTKTGHDNRIRSVKSSKRRMVWIEPEHGILIHATLAVPRHSSRRHARETSTATTSTSRSLSSDSPSTPLDDQLVLSSLEKAYHSYRLQYGRITAKLGAAGKEETMGDLEAFWSQWVANWDLAAETDTKSAIQQVLGGFLMSPLLTPPLLAQFRPLVAQFSASNSSMLPILLHASHVLHLPDLSSSFLDSESLGPLVDYLLSLHSVRLPSITAPTENLDSNLLPRDAPVPSASSSNWTSSALSYLDPRNVPLPAFSSAAASSFLVNPFGTSLDSSSTTTGRNDLRKEFAQLRRESRRPTRDRTDSTTSFASATTDSGSLRSKKEGNRHRREESASEASDRKEQAGGGGGGGGGTGWGLRSVSKSWSKLGAAFTGATGGGATDVPPVPPLPSTDPSSAPAAPQTSTGTGADPVEVLPVPQTTDGASPTEDRPDSVDTEVATSPETPKVELAPEVNEEDLMEAMKGLELRVGSAADNEMAAKAVGESAGGTKVETGKEEEEQDQVLKLFGGKNDESFEVRIIKRGTVTLALASLPAGPAVDLATVRNRASRMLEAVETLLEGAATTTVNPSQPSYIIKSDDSLHSHFSDRAGFKGASDSESSRESDLETTAAFLDAHRALNSSPRILESLTRLPTSSTWLSLSRSIHLLPPVLDQTSLERGESAPAVHEKMLEVVAVLPAKNSRARETTLVEAAEGARRIERKWVAQRCGP
ncbi:hypothetical protein JCM11491_001806 [Sporobolomyces phaffii]